MGRFFSEHFDSLEDLLTHQLQDIYDAKHRIVEVLSPMIAKATDPGLKETFELHLREGERQIKRLEEIFHEAGGEPKRRTCHAAEGLIEEAQEVIDAKGDSYVIDAALIAVAQRIEHYEMAAYGCARDFAKILGLNRTADLIQESLDETGKTDQELTDIAFSRVNPQGAAAF